MRKRSQSQLPCGPCDDGKMIERIFLSGSLKFPIWFTFHSQNFRLPQLTARGHIAASPRDHVSLQKSSGARVYMRIERALGEGDLG